MSGDDAFQIDDPITAAIEAAEEFADPVPERSDQKPRLLIENCDPDRTVAALRDILADSPMLYDRGVPVRLVFDQLQGGMTSQTMTPESLTLLAHKICRPYMVKTKSIDSASEVDARLPRSFAVMYLDWRGEWRLPPLNGIASAPLLHEDGEIHSTEGYDRASGMWCHRF